MKHKSVQQLFKNDAYQPEMTLQEIANVLGISKQRAEQIEKRALQKLRDPKIRDKWINVLETQAELDTRVSYGVGNMKMFSGYRSIDPVKVDEK